MTNKLEIDRELAERLLAWDVDGIRAVGELRALLSADLVPPLIQTLHANGDRIAMEATIAQQAQLIESLKYKSELYDEVWEKATGMGFMNVTMALEKLADLERGRGEPAAYYYRERVWATGLGDHIWREKLETERPSTEDREIKDLVPLYAEQPAPVAVMPSLWEICVRDEPDNPESPCEYVYARSTPARPCETAVIIGARCNRMPTRACKCVRESRKSHVPSSGVLPTEHNLLSQLFSNARRDTLCNLPVPSIVVVHIIWLPE